ncbi:uncharacterized protein C4orf50 homolog isoform X8 [Peromyscus californicus insignis]|uniref:uncharacterized protein C4orf50 homolog isoform X8 n=1 Tax=Peromyscus californicus insignis TaxID=564181 RepID=UPI0022A69DF8|nr:uncharacterized protein C4orf50 homolog isoform X8 [Peromyscus californicus insignis]
MEPTAQEQTEKRFSYVIRAPSGDGFDVMNVDVKIDTCWVFRDVEEGDDNEQGSLPEAASRPDLDTGLLREQLGSSERKLLAAGDKHGMSESGLRSRVQELEQSERKLLLKVEQLSACVAQERRASLYAQEQLRALQGELVSQVREAESAARRQQRLQERLRHKDEALARQAAALERCGWAQQLQLGLVREQERVLRAQVQRLERDVRRLGRAAGLLLAQLHAPDPLPSAGSPRPQILAGPLGTPEATELSALRVRAERAEREWAEAARRLREHSVTERQLREQLEELRCCVYGLTLSEIGLQSQVEELAQQNRRLRAQLGRGSLGAVGCAQSDSLPSPRAVVPDPCSSQGCHSDARGLQAPAGQLSEEPHSCGGDRPAPCVVVPARTIDKLQRDLPGSERRQGALVQPRLDGQTLGLLCSRLPEPGMDEPLCSLELAAVSESLQAAGAQEPLLLLPTSMLPLWGPAGEPQLLLSPLLPDHLLQELQTQKELDSKPSPAPGAVAPPGWPCNLARSHVTSLNQESPLTKGSKEPRDMWEERSGPPVASAEKWEVMGTLGMIKLELEDKSLLDQESSGKLILDTEVQAPEGMQEGSRASETQPVAHCPRLRPECLIPTLHGTTSRPQERPDSLRKRGSVEGCGWELLGKLPPEKEEEATSSRAHETREPESNGSQLPSGKGKEVWRRAWGKQDHQLCLEDTQLQKGRSGDEDQEEKMQLPVIPSPASLGVPEQPGVKAHAGQEQCLPMGDQDWLQFPNWAPAGASSEGPCPSQALVTGQDRCTLQIDTLEREVEACFQPLNNLKLVCGDLQQISALTRESQSVTHAWLDTEECVCLQQPSGSQDLNAKSSRNGEGGRREEDVALCTGEVPPGASLDGDKVNWGPAELGGSPFPTTWYTLKRAGSRSHQLLATPKKERSQVLLDHARLRGAQEGCHHEGRHCEEELAGEAAKALRLEQANHTLQGELGHLRRELDQCLQAVSDLEDCNGKSYCKISQLEEENEKLKGDLGRLHKAMSQSVRKAGSRMKHATQENRELRALISELGVSYKGLIKDTVLGIEDMVWALQGENKHLVGRVQGLEREVLQMNRDSREEKLCSQGNSKMAGDEGHTEDKEVQVTPFSGQLITGACGPPWDEKLGVTWGQAEPSLDLEDTRCRTVASSAPSVCAVTSGPQEAHTNGERRIGTRLQKEQETPWCSMQPGQSQGSLSRSLQFQTSKTDAPEEDPKLCVQRLHHQLEELREEQREARLAMSPLKKL